MAAAEVVVAVVAGAVLAVGEVARVTVAAVAGLAKVVVKTPQEVMAAEAAAAPTEEMVASGAAPDVRHSRCSQFRTHTRQHTRYLVHRRRIHRPWQSSTSRGRMGRDQGVVVRATEVAAAVVASASDALTHSLGSRYRAHRRHTQRQGPRHHTHHRSRRHSDCCTLAP